MIDNLLDQAFTPERIKQAFIEYKQSKKDRFSPSATPIYRVPMGADGVTWQVFEKQIEMHAESICKRIQAGNYQFYAFREVQVEKEPAIGDKPAKYRTLSIACIRDVLVQSILYRDVLSERFEHLFASLDFPLTVSYAYRRGKSAPRAASYVFNLIAKKQYFHVFDADIQSYFDSIPHDNLLNRIATELGDTSTRTFNLIRRFIKADRIPYDTYSDIGTKAFLSKNIKRVKRHSGIPQGGVLSGMLANLYLHDFDLWLSRELLAQSALRYVRYADDFIVLSPSAEPLESVHKEIEHRIETLGLALHPDKTGTVDIRDKGLNFVGFHFSPKGLRVRDKNINRYKDRVRKILTTSPKTKKSKQLHTVVERLEWLSWRLSYKVHGYSEKTTCDICQSPRVARPRSWMAFFRIVTNETQLRQLDRWTREAVSDHIWKRYGVRLQRRDYRRVKFQSLVAEWHRIRRLRMVPCKCDLQAKGLWYYARDLYVNRYFYTPQRRRPFRVNKVTSVKLHMSIKGIDYEISRQLLESIYQEMQTISHITRSNLEQRDILHSSQIIVLLSLLPGLSSRIKPVRLINDGKHHVTDDYANLI